METWKVKTNQQQEPGQRTSKHPSAKGVKRFCAEKLIKDLDNYLFKIRSLSHIHIHRSASLASDESVGFGRVVRRVSWQLRLGLAV